MWQEMAHTDLAGVHGVDGVGLEAVDERAAGLRLALVLRPRSRSRSGLRPSSSCRARRSRRRRRRRTQRRSATGRVAVRAAGATGWTWICSSRFPLDRWRREGPARRLLVHRRVSAVTSAGRKSLVGRVSIAPPVKTADRRVRPGRPGDTRHTVGPPGACISRGSVTESSCPAAGGGATRIRDAPGAAGRLAWARRHGTCVGAGGRSAPGRTVAPRRTVGQAGPMSRRRRRRGDRVGPNGLAAAIEVARAGCSVTVLEAVDTPAAAPGRRELTGPGYLHDVCSAIHPLATGSPFFRSVPLAEHGCELVHPDIPVVHPLDGGRAGRLPPVGGRDRCGGRCRRQGVGGAVRPPRRRTGTTSRRTCSGRSCVRPATRSPSPGSV